MQSLSKGKLFSTAVGISKGLDFFQSRTNAEHLLQGSRAVADTQSRQFINDALIDFANSDKNLIYLNNFVNQFTQWIEIPGLSNLESDFSAGTTQAFDSFYFRHREKRFRCFVGEYFYHLKTWQSNQVNWSFIDDDNELVTGDALVLSIPFCDTGNIEYLDILNYCDRHQIPVLLDLCYYPLTRGFKIELDHACIDTVVFSLSKIYPVAHYRIGVRYTKPGIQDGQKLHHSIHYNNVLSAYLGLKLINNFTVSALFDKFRVQQLEACDFFELEPSSSVIFGIGNNQWNMYSRSNLLKIYDLSFDPKMFSNRICLTPIFENWDLFKKFKNEY